jgi:hypothetical protein
MKQWLIAGGVLTLAMGVSVRAQQATFTPDRRLEAEKAIRAAQPMKTPVVDVRLTQGRPYSAEAITEFVQVLSDGNRITRRTVTRTFRDSEGRTRREQTKPGDDIEQVTIVDPVGHVSFVLEAQTRTAWRQPTMIATARMRTPAGRGGGTPEASWTVVMPRMTDQERREAETTGRVALAENAREMSGQLKKAQERAASGEGTSTREDLGTQTVEGILAEGTRITTVIPAGGIGNEQPIKIVSEQWYSPDLQVFVMTKHSDPRSGETTYRLANISRGEPDRLLFEVPADYAIKEAGFRRTPMPRE